MYFWFFNSLLGEYLAKIFLLFDLLLVVDEYLKYIHEIFIDYVNLMQFYFLMERPKVIIHIIV
jgi:hypothetical protein